MRKQMDPERERNLLDRAREDAAAFHELYDHYFPRIYAYIGYQIGRNQDISLDDYST